MNVDVFLTAFVSYFVIIDPIGVAFVFSALTRGRGEKYRQAMAQRSVLLSTGIVFLFGFLGADLLERLGISIESFRIAGGLLLFYTAFTMVTTGKDKMRDQDGADPDDISVFPLSIPMIAGPGCLTLTILLFSKARGVEGAHVALIFAFVAVCALTFAGFIASEKMTRLVGKTGDDVLRRLFGVLLAALSIQFIMDGVKGFGF